MTGKSKKGSNRTPYERALEAEVLRLKEALSYTGAFCEYLHHPPKYQHKPSEPCPVERRMDALTGDGRGRLFGPESR